MKYSLALISASLLLAVSDAATVKFNVIAPGATDVKVSVNGQQVSLTASIQDVPYFSGDAEVGSSNSYNYIVGGVQETFSRTLDTSKNSTLNDFYNRKITYANLPQLPWPIENDAQWTREGGKPAIFDDNYVHSVFFSGDATEVNNIVKNVPKDRVTGSLTFITADTVNTFQNVSFGIHGAGKKHNNAKQSWNWRLSPGDELGKRTFFKLRHMEEDPTQIRERLYSDILHAMGTYANEATMTRLFINGQGFGTFNMLDDITRFSYINAMFYGGKAPETQGLLFDGQSGADFLYHPDNLDDYSSWAAAEGNAETYEALDPLCKAFNETNVQDNASLAAFEKQFDVDQFLRFMVAEYLNGHWDGYWMGQTNDGAFKEGETNKWYYLGQDYDGTFGVNLAVDDANAYMSASYTEWPSMYPGGIMINRLLENPDKKATFEKYLTETVRVLYNNVTLTNRVLAIHDFLLEDLEWDRSITQQSPGINFGWTFDQVTKNLWEAVDAPNANGGGAGYGLIQWIAERSAAVAKEFKIAVVTEPVGPPTTANNSTTVTSSGGSAASNNSDSNDTTQSQSSSITAESGAIQIIPGFITALAFFAAYVTL